MERTATTLRTYLDFEKPIAELESKVADLQALNSDNSFDGRVQAKRAAFAAMQVARAAK